MLPPLSGDEVSRDTTGLVIDLIGYNVRDSAMVSVMNILSQIPDKEELLIGGFNITKNLDLLQNYWQFRKTVGALTEDTKLERPKGESLGGEIFCLRVHCEQPQLLAAIDVRTPMGLYYNVRRKELFTGSDHWIAKIRGGKVLSYLDNPWFNDIHWISPSPRKDFEAILVASTGIDAVLEINLDNPEQCLRDWFATEHGYEHSLNGQRREVPRNLVHQGIDYPTPTHTTHVNSILPLGNDSLLATLFTPGQLVQIDLNSKDVKIIIDGLKHPHGIRKLHDGGFILSDTANNKVIILNEAFQVEREITSEFNWVKDAYELSDGSIVIVDCNNYRLVRVDKLGNCLWEWMVETDRHLSSLLALPASACKSVFCGR